MSDTSKPSDQSDPLKIRSLQWKDLPNYNSCSQELDFAVHGGSQAVGCSLADVFDEMIEYDTERILEIRLTTVGTICLIEIPGCMNRHRLRPSIWQLELGGIEN